MFANILMFVAALFCGFGSYFAFDQYQTWTHDWWFAIVSFVLIGCTFLTGGSFLSNLFDDLVAFDAGRPKRKEQRRLRRASRSSGR